MIRKLRRKFLGIAMLALLGTLAFLVAAIATGNAILSANRADRAIALLYENGGAFPCPTPPRTRPWALTFRSARRRPLRRAISSRAFPKTRKCSPWTRSTSPRWTARP